MSKSLPTNPSLQQLKQQARDLQRNIGVAAPDAFVRLKAGVPIWPVCQTLRYLLATKT